MVASLAEFCLFLRSRKKLWLLPILTLMLIGCLLAVVAQSSAVAPLIYTLF